LVAKQEQLEQPAAHGASSPAAHLEGTVNRLESEVREPAGKYVSHSLSAARNEEVAYELPDLVGPMVDRIDANLARLQESLSRIEAKLERVAA
jgi:hypothetical protein